MSFGWTGTLPALKLFWTLIWVNTSPWNKETPWGEGGRCCQMPPNAFVKCFCGILPGYLPRHFFQTSVMLINFSGQLLIDKYATFLISHQEEDTALLFLPKKCQVSERHVACPQELLGFKPGTSILLVHNSLAWKLCTVHSPSKSCSVEDVFPCQYIKSQIILLYDVKSYYIKPFCIILYYSSIYLYIHIYIYYLHYYVILYFKLL